MGEKAQPDAAPPKRGEAAWKAQKERIAARNDEARKAAKQVREAHERQEAARRKAADRRERASLTNR